MPSRLVQFDVDSLLKLLVHYSEGELPLDSKVVNVIGAALAIYGRANPKQVPKS